MTDDFDFSSYLKRLRKDSGLTVRQLQAETGVSGAYLSQLENGIRRPSPDIIKKIHSPLGVSYEQMMEYAGYLSSDYHYLKQLPEEKREIAEVFIKYLYDKEMLNEEDKKKLKASAYYVLGDLVQ
ncbi:helix-turn-helix domain-containing protein [Cytobacillus oceanisediminis]|uniref:helix-turn-helix domain-containing protein n=1 Tax=Cytobacillus oceanisediminis TaxID=665099 RepID=UPI001FB35FA8|nr:helix-turn-helix transcriptional regulator [Cytobacillus oceanisediminis]UOE58012.1 helix-turn-helix transcriptional regulator [Cytobacillus oceanisediminis]